MRRDIIYDGNCYLEGRKNRWLLPSTNLTRDFNAFFYQLLNHSVDGWPAFTFAVSV